MNAVIPEVKLWVWLQPWLQHYELYFYLFCVVVEGNKTESCDSVVEYFWTFTSCA
jgi:hypothetical protein